MDVFTKDNLKALLSERETPRISMYLPTHRSMPDAIQNPIRLRKFLTEAERQLGVNSRKPTHAANMLQGVHSLLDDYSFWQHPSDGLAIFIAPNMFERYRLPIPFDELLVVAERFHVKPLLPYLSGDGRYYILAVSQKDVRFYRGTRQSIRQLPLEDVPKNLAEIMATDSSGRAPQFHSRTPGASADRSATYHGHGVGTEDQKDLILRYFRLIDHGVHELLHNETAPLVIVGVEYLHPLYREVNSYKYFLDKGVHGNPDGWSEEELRQHAWTLVQPHLEARRDGSAAALWGRPGSEVVVDEPCGNCPGRPCRARRHADHREWADTVGNV